MPDGTGPQDERDERRTLRVERTERDDGRYLIYYSWSEEPPAERPAPALGEPAEAHDV